MDTIVSMTPFLAVLVSLVAVPGIVSAKSPNAREAWTFVAAFVKFGLVVSMLPTVLAGHTISYTVAEVLPGASLAFRVDPMGMLFALVSSSLWILTSAYSVGYMRAEHEHSQTRYFTFFALALSATIGVAFAANLFTLYLFYEMLSFATYPLVTHHQDKEARSSGRKYLFYIVGSSIGLALPAMLIVYMLAGTLNFVPHGILSSLPDMANHTTLIGILLVMFLFGFAKAGLMPLHSWLPAAMVAPTPVSALLHAVAVVKVGAFSIFRVVTMVFGADILVHMNLRIVILVIAGVTMITASLIAISQDGLKRRLAFSTIAQLSYIVLGAGLLTPKGLTGGMMHIALHAFGKITLFMCAGAIFVATGKSKISEMTGIGRRMPWTMTAFFIGALSIIGLPPCAGFISKWYLLQGSLQANEPIFVVVILTSGLLNAAYFMPIVYRAFFCKPSESQFEAGVKEAPFLCIAPPIVTAIVSILLLFHPGPFMDLAKMMTQALLGM
ncbi:monovalent cation/H+ antiporter subunit D family protein [Oceanidesulfovibrio marinus]|uniref:Monovalent cation/H+ antiporter subunit D family protein n=1 Tax=Oceanidesulfovibrio marinus TaxID=370038 RepID=A0A6P1ZK62_9BACT|nr:monovalent cation/H+ antiporter subunit D family protein [Oceanidesulfovibrio marinus]QJT07603.1 monovalent cation/H+ antiporter subunit D family protein [Oceanidesulfovibrio marinus]TVM34483.1 monovalent cation/H+ antiporter subunit D family protein [Oceanidesulfovibrio marinus]